LQMDNKKWCLPFEFFIPRLAHSDGLFDKHGRVKNQDFALLGHLEKGTALE